MSFKPPHFATAAFFAVSLSGLSSSLMAQECHCKIKRTKYLLTATRGLSAVQNLPKNTPAYEQALRSELEKIRVEVSTPGTKLNDWVTKK